MTLHRTRIPYLTHAANWQAGCSPVHTGCARCWALSMSRRLDAQAARGKAGVEHYRGTTEGDPLRWTGRVRYSEDAMDAAFLGMARLRAPAVIGINFMSDTFHEHAPPEALETFATALHTSDHSCAGHVFVIPTKRPAIAAAWQQLHFSRGLPDSVCILASISDQATADHLVPELLRIRGGILGVSIEPQVGEVNLTANRLPGWFEAPGDWRMNVLEGWYGTDVRHGTIRRIGWVITGCEALGARPGREHDMEWAARMERDCEAAGIPHWLKQYQVGRTVEEAAHPAADMHRFAPPAIARVLRERKGVSHV